MPDDTPSAPAGSLAELYLDLLWNLSASARIMVIELPTLTSSVSDHALVVLLRDALSVADERHAELEGVLQGFGEPARVHAAELEALLGSATRRLVDWPAGDTRDLALCQLIRGAVYVAMPASELAATLAAALGYDGHIAMLERFRDDLTRIDDRVQRIERARVAAYRVAVGRSPGSVAPRSADARPPRSERA